MHCVKPVVLCFFSIDDTIRPEHFKYDSSDGSRDNFIVGNQKDIYTYIVQHFSQPKSVILDLTTSYSEGTQLKIIILIIIDNDNTYCSVGVASLCALKCDRYAVCVVESDGHMPKVVEQLSTLHNEE